MKFSRIVPAVGGHTVKAGTKLRLNQDQHDRRAYGRQIKVERRDTDGRYHCEALQDLTFKAGDAVEVAE